MAKIKVSDYIAKRLKEEYGIKRIFMVSGGGAMHLNDSFGRYIPYTANHHEQACALSAEGYARTNQNLAVVNVTTGPGGLNCLNGVFGQWTDSVPVLYISGQVKYSTTMSSCSNIPLRQLGDQEVDIISCVKPLVKYAKMVTEPNEIKYHLDRAIFEATHDRKGPVWLDIPMNVQAAIINEDDLIEFNPPEKKSYNLKINDVIEKLKQAKKPLIILGHGIRLSKQIDNFKKLISMLQIPVVTTFNGFDMIESDNPYYAGRIGTIGQRAGNFTLQNADLILCLGTRNNIRQVSYNWENFAKNAYKIVVDIDSAELDKPTLTPDLKINADLEDFIPSLIEKIKDDFSFGNNSNDIKSWLEFCKKLKEKYSKIEHTQKDKINPYHFIYELTKLLDENSIVVSANATPSICIFQNGIIKNNQRVLVNSGDASMGFALSAAIGASYEAGDRNVICLEGDGSIMMNIQELQTIAFNKLPIKIFVINNQGYSSIRQSQKNFFNGHMTASGIDSGVCCPDFIKVAQAFNLKTKRIENPNSVEKDIKEVLAEKGAILCEVIVEKDYSFAPKLSAKKLDDGTMISPSLEDMYPFLDREEYKENIY